MSRHFLLAAYVRWLPLPVLLKKRKSNEKNLNGSICNDKLQRLFLKVESHKKILKHILDTNCIFHESFHMKNQIFESPSPDFLLDLLVFSMSFMSLATRSVQPVNQITLQGNVLKFAPKCYIHQSYRLLFRATPLFWDQDILSDNVGSLLRR